MKTLFSIGFLSILVSGCAGIGIRGGVSGDDLQSIKRVAVYSNLQPTMNHISVGVTKFSDKYQTFDVSNWKINQYAENQLVRQLSENPAFHVGTLKNKPAPGTPWNLDTVAWLQKEARSEGYDTLVILDPSGYANAPALKPGYGIARISRLRSPIFSVYLLAIMSVYNTSKSAALGWDWTMASTGSSNLSQVPPWKDNPADFTPDELSKIKSIVKYRVATQVGEGLKRNHLIK